MKAAIFVLILLLAVPSGAAERFKPLGEGEDDSLDKNHSVVVLVWTHPVYPRELKATGGPASVRVRFIVDETGAVTSPETIAGDERFYAAALAAIKQWKYRPELRNGQQVPVSREVNFQFSPAGPPKTTSKLLPPYPEETSPATPPVRVSAPDPDYPKWLEGRRLFGSVEMKVSINEKGRVDGVGVASVTHPDFLTAALEAVAAWEFRPAGSGRIPLRGEQQAVLQFVVIDPETGRETRVDWLERNGIFLREPADTKTQDYFDTSPEAIVMVDPVYPAELLRSATRGGARVNFSVDGRGRVTDITEVEATAPEFGASLAAAIAAWQFAPLRRHHEVTRADFSITWKFAEPRPESVEQRLLAARERGEKPVNARLLDRPLRPLYVRAPVYPAVYRDTQTTGEADIEVTIDRDGRARLPRIVSATKPEFGWAAATAASQWFFETPLQGGKAVDTRAVIPVEFKPE